MAQDDPLRVHLVEAAAHVRPILMGSILLLVMRFSPRGMVPETVGGEGLRIFGRWPRNRSKNESALRVGEEL